MFLCIKIKIKIKMGNTVKWTRGSFLEIAKSRNELSVDLTCKWNKFIHLLHINWSNGYTHNRAQSQPKFSYATLTELSILNVTGQTD